MNSSQSVDRVKRAKQQQQQFGQQKTVQKLKKQKHCKIKVGTVEKPKQALLPSHQEYEQSMAPERITQEIPIVHNFKSTVTTEEDSDLITHYEGEISDKSTQKIHDEKSQDISFSTQSIGDIVQELQDQQVTEKENPRTIEEQMEQEQAVQTIEEQMEQEQAVQTIMKELSSGGEVENEPDPQIIDRGGEDDGITIINIDDVIESRVKSQDVPHIFTKQEQDSRITELINTGLKIPGRKVVTVQPIAYNDELFGDNFPIVCIDIEQEIVPHEDTLMPTETLPPKDKTYTTKECTTHVPSTATALSTKESHSTKTNTIQEKLTNILPAMKHDELEVYIPPVISTSKSLSVLTYKPRETKSEKTSVTVHKWIDQSRIGNPVPSKQQLSNLYYCDKCPKSFKDKVYFRKHMSRLCPGLSEPECLKCKYCDKLYRQDKNYRQHLSTHDGIKRFTCKRCGEKFMTDSEVMKHRKLYCTKKK